VGKREAEAGNVAVRARGVGDIGTLPVSEFAKKLVEEIKTRSNVLEIKKQ
jgi:threonyl-tRNA synthetase